LIIFTVLNNTNTMETKTHYKKLQHPDYLGAYALENGKDMVLTIREVKNEMVTGADGKKEECVVAYFKEAGTKPMIMNSTNLKTIAKIYKSPYIEDWANKQIQLYGKVVKAFGDEVLALRIREAIPKATKLPLSAEDLPKAKAAIQAKSTTIEAIEARYIVTPEQRKELTNA
jgi:hypothetical protein